MNKLNKKLLETELSICGMSFEDVSIYTKDLFPLLLSRFSDVEITEEFYCCNGLEQSCWIELYYDGNWGRTLLDVRNEVLSIYRSFAKYLYNINKYGNRLYVVEKENKVRVFVYLRDVIGKDYTFDFYNIEEM